MKTILVINDDTPEAKHAGLLAMRLAKKAEASLLIVLTITATVKKHALVVAGPIEVDDAGCSNSMSDELKLLNEQSGGFHPQISNLSYEGKFENVIGKIAIQHKVWLVIMGTKDATDQTYDADSYKAQAIINKIHCPLLLLPLSYRYSDFERIAHIVDLRYCRLDIIKFLTEFASPLNASFTLAHFASGGIPDLEPKYAQLIFEREIRSSSAYRKLFFLHVKERNLIKAMDVLINALQTDLVAVVNHRYHFKQLIGDSITGKHPMHTPVPMLIFPG